MGPFGLQEARSRPTRAAAANRVTVNLPESVSCTYDAAGNLTSDGAVSYGYDGLGRLIFAEVPSSWHTSFTYAGLYRLRIRKDYRWIVVTS